MPASLSPSARSSAIRRESDQVLRSRLPRWLVQVLRDNGIRRMSRLETMSDADILALDGVGRRSLELIHAELSRLRSATSGEPSASSAAHP